MRKNQPHDSYKTLEKVDDDIKIDEDTVKLGSPSQKNEKELMK